MQFWLASIHSCKTGLSPSLESKSIWNRSCLGSFKFSMFRSNRMLWRFSRFRLNLHSGEREGELMRNLCCWTRKIAVICVCADVDRMSNSTRYHWAWRLSLLVLSLVVQRHCHDAFTDCEMQLWIFLPIVECCMLLWVPSNTTYCIGRWRLTVIWTVLY